MSDRPTHVPRMPYGMAKRIVAAMEIGDVCVVRPAWVVSMHNAARRLGVKLAAVSFERDGVPMFRMLRIGQGWRSGHAVARRPKHAANGRWERAA
jgi:hypothetical protein